MPLVQLLEDFFTQYVQGMIFIWYIFWFKFVGNISGKYDLVSILKLIKLNKEVMSINVTLKKRYWFSFFLWIPMLLSARFQYSCCLRDATSPPTPPLHHSEVEHLVIPAFSSTEHIEEINKDISNWVIKAAVKCCHQCSFILNDLISRLVVLNFHFLSRVALWLVQFQL